MVLSPVKSLIFNALWFQCCWLGAVVLQNNILLLAMLAVHFLWFVERSKAEFKATLCCAIIGIGVDQLLTHYQIFGFATQWIPLWLVLLWWCFCCSLGHSLRFLKGRILICSLFGGIGGAASYFAGSRLGAVDFNYSDLTSVLIIAAVWSLLCPILVSTYHKIRGA